MSLNVSQAATPLSIRDFTSTVLDFQHVNRLLHFSNNLENGANNSHPQGNQSDLANYQPITLLLLLSKTIEYLVHQQLKNYLDGNKLLHAAQHGLRSKHSCCMALLDISTTLSTAKNKGLYTAMAALDYSKVFDTINHSILLRKMKIINFDANALSWFDLTIAELSWAQCPPRTVSRKGTSWARALPHLPE